MSVLPVARIAPQQLAAFQVSTANATVSFGLQNAMMAVGSAAAMKVTTGLGVPNLLQVTIAQPSLPDQIAWPGDWILVTDATYNDTTSTWTVASTTQVIVYGRAAGSVGTAADFVATFTSDIPLVWSQAAPTAEATTGDAMTVTFDAPTSPTGPFTWTYTLTNTTTKTTGTPTAFTPTTNTDGTLVATIPALTTGDAYTATITVTDNYKHTATSAPTNTITAQT